MNSINARPVIGPLPLPIPASFAKGGKQPVNVRAIRAEALPAAADGRISHGDGYGGKTMTGGWRATFPLFLAGAFLYAAVVSAFMRSVGNDVLNLLELATPLFGLPMLAAGRRSWRLAFYLLLLVPAFHYLAVLAAIKSVDWRGSGFLPGAIGGSIGAVLSFAVLPMLGLARFRRAGIMALGIVVLALLGGIGVSKMNAFSGTALDSYGLLLTLYLPWQIAFGFFLSRLLAAPEEIGLAAEPAPA
jgi:hypothetical protein